MTSQQRFLLGLAAGVGAVVAGTEAMRRRHAVDFTGRTVLITGGSRGLGLVLARQFAEQGARLCLLARDYGELERARQQLEATGGDVMILKCDVTQRAGVRAAVDQIFERWITIDVLINNAGIIQVGPLEHMREEDFENAMATHFWGPLHLMFEVVPSMRRRGGGSIVVATSSSVKEPLPNLALSNVMRGGVSSLSKTLSLELAKDHIRVNQLMPGRIDTDRLRYLDEANAKKFGVTPEEQKAKAIAAIPQGRYGNADEFGRAAAFLLSDAASYITGATLQVDGGLIKGVL
jgi:3-oxoacyl-[acyl-carrier protein] reductase